jgi:hypothetical protein
VITAQQADTLRLARKMLTELAGDDALSGRARAALSDAEAGLDRVLGSEPIEAPAPDWERKGNYWWPAYFTQLSFADAVRAHGWRFSEQRDRGASAKPEKAEVSTHYR